MATTASPLSPTAIAGPSASSPSASRDPQRASRPPQPRPTTYSGLPPTTASAQVPYQTSPSQVPVSIPPRTSSQRQGPPMGPTAAEPRAERSRSAGERGPVSSERRSDRDRDREREREATDGGRTRRAPSAATAAPAAAADSAQRRNSTSQREESSRRNTTGTTAPAQANGTRPDTNSSRGTSRTAAPEGERRETTRGRKETRFGDYILGQTLGEGEFGKVKLGWRRDGGVQVAIKLIRRDTLAPHPSRLSKIYREISILRTLSHPNIVRLHEMVETERHIGIILEYASGGELFDFILTHRFLKDPPACRLFAQLVSGVGYLHKKGIVHRDLKLENLLLDRNRNIIITDFGFANVFDPSDELGEELESKLGEPEILKELEKGVAKKDENTGGIWDELGLKGGIRRRGDLMATSCGSPCYAAPELVVSDGLYTGRKVDVWSCGVILYAMLAGYLPFDDDPANPEGDNINLLYKYIVSTPLTFPEYVSPHARDLLRRILVPDPRKRADLFEVARHSWLSPFANVVGLITSSTTSEKEISNTTVGDELNGEVPLLTRSASVREPSTTNSAHPHATTLGGRHGGHHEHTAQPTQQKVAVDNKRRTVQVEYVAPNSQTKRGDQQGAEASRASNDAGRHNNSRDRPATKDLVVPKPDSALARAATTAGVNTRQSTHADNGRPPTAGEGSSRLPVPQSKTRPASYQYQQAHATQTPASTANAKEVQIPQRRPSTKGRDGPVPVQSKTLPQLQQPVTSNARPGTGGSSTGTSNRLPSRGGSYSRGSAPAAAPSVTTAANAQGKLQQPQSGKPSIGTPSTQPMPAKYRPSTQEALAQKDRGHKRANTVTGTSGGVLSRLMGGSGASRESSQEKSPRASIDQGINNTLNVKPQPPAKSRRFSLLPPSFSLRGIGSGDKKGHERRPSRSASGNSVQQRRWDNQQQNPQVVGGGSSYPQLGVPSSRPAHNGSLSGSEASLAVASAPGTATQPNFPQSSHTPSPEQIPASGNHTGTTPTPGTIPSRPSEEARKRPAVLQKNRKFTEAYEMDGAGAASSGSSGAARRVMDFFRRRGVNRNK